MLHQIDLTRVDLNLLTLFEAVMEHRHVGRAAERLHLSPSAVSHGLRRLRDTLGDPLFLRTPRGVVPTDRALHLAGSIAEILARVREVVASAEPFDPRRSTRRFTLGAPDGASSVFLPVLLGDLARAAPGIDLRVRQLLPRAGSPLPGPAWGDSLAELEARTLDVAILPTADVPARFLVRPLYPEDFVVAMRAGHPLRRDMSLGRYCAAAHLVVSQSGDAQGIADAALAEHGLFRRVALTVPNFMFALAMLADSDLLSALPRRFVAMHGARFGVVAVEAPVALARSTLVIVTPKDAVRDAAVAWLVQRLEKAGEAVQHSTADAS